MTSEVGRPLRATYRLQLRNGIGFREAEALLPYLAELGISHVYLSPCMEAHSESTHGYDVVDPTAVDPALGGEAAFDAFAAALHRHGLGQLLDWVPNHVGIAHGENPWWQHVLEFGAASPFAEFFDIDWEPARPELRGKVLLPVLGNHYGAVLERGELEPVWEEAGGLGIRYFEHRFPISPVSGARLLAKRLLAPDATPALPADRREALAAALEPLTSDARSARRPAEAEAGKRALAELVASDPVLLEAVQDAVASLRGKPGERRSHDALHRLLELQHYRLAYWRVAAEEINYRRFFDIDDLAALRMERSEVFERTHEQVLTWIESGAIDGLRIDHVDGLADPRGYCERLRQRSSRPDLYLVVEKILGADELLHHDWPVDGTTGYEFLNELNGLFVDPRGAAPFARLHRRFTGDPRSFDEILYASKKRVMRALLAGELESLASRLDRIAQRDRWTRDYTRSALRDALEEVVAHFPVYRSYVAASGASPGDRRRIASAIAQARRSAVDPASGLFEWLERVLTGDILSGLPRARRREVLRFVTRFQQYTAPVMAKGFEDTALYRYHPLVSLSEVGGDPRRFGRSVEAFHVANHTRGVDWPRTMLCTSTHDTKRGEDVRARLDVLSELPERWSEEVQAWTRLNRRQKREVEREPAPSRKDELLLYQVLVGSWPAREPDARELEVYRERVQGYLQKAQREAKERSSWRHPDHAYEEATSEFVAALLTPGSAFLDAFRPFQAEVAELGASNSLAALTLKLCAPGVPDLYQGCELWDLSLADPDNRRPVDFEARRTALAALAEETGGAAAEAPAPLLRSLLTGWRDGRIKLFLSWRLLAARRARPHLFVGAEYLPLETRGEHASRVCAFARRHGDDCVIALAPRLAARLPRGDVPFPLGRASWGDTELVLPPGLEDARWCDIVSGRARRARAGGLALADAFSELPVAALAAPPGERSA